MEPNPIYQGTQYTAANTATSNANVPRKLLFAEEWERNRHATTQALQGIEQALIERNDNTVLLNQQAEAKRRDLEMTMEMKSILDLDNGVEGSWYDNNGKLNKQAVRDFIKKYSTMPTQWAKATRSPEAQQKSASMSQAYQIGVQEAVEAAILANTKKREQQAYKDNMRLATEMKDWNERDRITDAAEANGALSPAEAATEKIISERGRLAQEIDECDTTDKLLDKWYDPDFQQRISDPAYSELKEAMQKKIEHDNSTQAITTGDYYELDPKTGKRKAVAGTVTPPDGAPYYIQMLITQSNGKPKASDAHDAIMRYLSEEVTELDSTEAGARQKAQVKGMARTLGMTEADFANVYELRAKQLRPGGFNAKAILDSMTDVHWLMTTEEDNNLPDTLTREEKRKELDRIYTARRNKILQEYNRWWSQNGKEKISSRDQYTKLLEILEKNSGYEPITKAINLQSRDFLNREKAIEKEKIDTADRKRRTAEWTEQWKEVPWYSEFAPQVWQTSTNVQFRYDLAPVNTSLPDSKTHNIIYLPKDVDIPAESANVAIKKGSLGFTIEFRHADVKKPTPSRKLLRSMGIPTFSPASISWDGYGLEVSDYEAEDTSEHSYEYATPVSDTADIFPDDGLAHDGGTDPVADNNEPLPVD